jgi:hypothetical protein
MTKLIQIPIDTAGSGGKNEQGNRQLHKSLEIHVSRPIIRQRALFPLFYFFLLHI